MKSALLKFSNTSTHLVSVKVYATRNAMRGALSRLGHRHSRQSDACCWQADKPGKDCVVAGIHLAKTHLTLENIVHECLHAASHRVKLMGLPVDGYDFEEYLAAAVGLLSDTLLAWCDQQKLRVKLNCVPARRVITVKL